ncbi:MAG TPA: hypothetical protein QF458_03745, partial [Candidatus Woesearchaeota archaeon]|nr:hypothetical protein [Candidatus Woesearchaeota archaeon]
MMGKNKEVNKSNLAKRIFFILTIALFLLIGLVMASADEVQKEKIKNLEKEEISDDASQELLKEYYGNLLGYVGTKKFNSIATKENIGNGTLFDQADLIFGDLGLKLKVIL